MSSREHHESGGSSPGGGDSSGVGEAPTGEHRPDHSSLSGTADNREHVGHDPGRWFDLCSRQLVKETYEAAVAGELSLAGQTRLHVRHERGGGRQAVIEDPRQLGGHVGAADEGEPAPRTGK
jgi:hypothetical protein